VLLHYVVKRRNAKIAFFPQCCITALPEVNQLLDFFNLFDSRLILTLLYDSLSLVINAFSYWGHGSGERKDFDSVAAVGLCCTHNTPVHCLLGSLFRKIMQKR